jgi:hypothetical protein
LGAPIGLFPSGFLIKILYAFLFYPACISCMLHTHLVILYLIVLIMFHVKKDEEIKIQFFLNTYKIYYME